MLNKIQTLNEYKSGLTKLSILGFIAKILHKPF